MVHLNSLHVDMTGRYTCEVSTEGIFETDRATADMNVVALPRGGPHIQGYEQRERGAARAAAPVGIGDTVMLNCTSLKSKPAARLDFYVNGRKVEGGSRRKSAAKLQRYLVVNEEEDPQTESAILSMEFVVRRHHVHHGRIDVR